MKKPIQAQFKIILFSIVTLFSTAAFSQYLEIPYYEAFEDESFSNSWQIQQAKNNRIRLEKISEYNSNSLHITVHENDHPAMTVKNDGRTRAEVALLNHHIENENVFFYSWDLFIPRLQNFTTNPSLTNENYYVIMQWHEAGDGRPTYCLRGSDIRKVRAFPISLRLIPSSLEQHSKMNLHLKYGTTYGPGNSTDDGDICPQDPYSRGYREYIIEKAINMGEWNRIVTEIKWSIDGDLAYIRMWINDLPIINDRNIPQYNRKGKNPNLYLGEEGSQASKLGGVPLLYTRMERGKLVIEQNYQKLGHYRKNYDSDNTILIDNYRITTEYPPKSFTTSLTDKYCNKELPLGSDYRLQAYEIAPSDYYSFNFKDEARNQTYTIRSHSNSINLTHQDWVRANETYEVRVRAINRLNDGKGFDYGKTCEVQIPGSTNLEDYYSSKSIFHPYSLRRGETVYAHILPGATDYLFKIMGTQDSTKVTWIPGNGKDINSLNLSRISGIKKNITYQISVKAARIEDGEDIYSHLNTDSSDFIQIKKPRKNIDKRIKITIDDSLDTVYIKSKSKLKKIYLISSLGEILLKSLVDLKETRMDLSLFKNQVYQIVAVDNKGNVFSIFLNTDAL